MVNIPPPGAPFCAPITPSRLRSICVAFSTCPVAPVPPTRPSPLKSIPVVFSILFVRKSIGKKNNLYCGKKAPIDR